MGVVGQSPAGAGLGRAVGGNAGDALKLRRYNDAE